MICQQVVGKSAQKVDFCVLRPSVSCKLIGIDEIRCTDDNNRYSAGKVRLLTGRTVFCKICLGCGFAPN